MLGHKPLVFLFLFAVLVMGAAGCVRPSLNATSTVTGVTESIDTWQRIDPHAEKLVHRFASSTEDDLVIYRFDADAFNFGFRHSSTSKLISEWQAGLPTADLVINGVYFQEDESPTGILIAQGRRIGKRTIDVTRSGLIELAPRPSIVEISTSTDLGGLTEAAQSYPFLIKDGQPAIDQDSGLTARRSFIGLDQNGRVYIGIVPSRLISLKYLATELQTLGIPWTDVINLDGGPSTGLATKFASDQTLIESQSHVPNVLTVEPKP